jgi:hypothetical protein
MQSTNPNIKKYHYHYAAIFYSRDEASLEAAGDSIKKTVPATHKEIPLLDEAYRQKRAELRAAAAQEADANHQNHPHRHHHQPQTRAGQTAKKGQRIKSMTNELPMLKNEWPYETTNV